MENINKNYQDFQQEDSIDIKALFFKIIKYWYLFAITIVIAFIIAFLFNKYNAPVYKVDTSVLIQEEKNKIDAQDLMGIGALQSNKNLENEIGILKSFSLTYNTVKKLDFVVSYFSEQKLMTKELYKDSPIKIIFDSLHPQPTDLKFYIKILSDNRFKIQANGDEIFLYNYSQSKYIEDKVKNVSVDKKYKFGDIISDKNFSFRIILTEKYITNEQKTKDFSFVFNSYESLTSKLSDFTVEPINREASIVKITTNTSNVKKSVDFLNKLTEEYLKRGLNKKK